MINTRRENNKGSYLKGKATLKKKGVPVFKVLLVELWLEGPKGGKELFSVLLLKGPGFWPPFRGIKLGFVRFFLMGPNLCRLLKLFWEKGFVGTLGFFFPHKVTPRVWNFSALKGLFPFGAP